MATEVLGWKSSDHFCEWTARPLARSRQTHMIASPVLGAIEEYFKTGRLHDSKAQETSRKWPESRSRLHLAAKNYFVSFLWVVGKETGPQIALVSLVLELDM